MIKRGLVWLAVVGTAALWFVGRTEAADCVPGADMPLEEGWTCAATEAAGQFETPARRLDSILNGVTYGWVEDYARFYAAPEVGADWVRTASAGFFYGPVQERARDGEGKAWLKVWDNWLPARYYHKVQTSAFRGMKVNAQPRRPFGWVLHEFETRAEPGGPVEAGAGRPLARYDFVQVYDVGDGQWVRYHALALLALRQPPQGLEAGEWWVDVDLSQQTFAAYEGQDMVFAGLISSGLPRWPTRRGLFRVWRTFLTTPMVGGEVGDDYYYLEDVPHTMFFDGDIALHGAYWHDDFGRPKSHGCVNIAPRAAEWLYYWAVGAPGDLRVWVHNSYHRDFG